MKRFALLLLPVCVFAQAPGQVQVTGVLHLAQPVSKVYILYRTPETAVTDSMDLKKGAFTFKTALAEPTLATLRVRYSGQAAANDGMDAIPIFLQPGKIRVKATKSLNHYTVKGSAAHANYLVLTAQAKPYTRSLDSLYDAWSRYSKEGTKEGQQAVAFQIDSINKALTENVYRTFAENHPRSPVAFYAIKQYASYNMDGDKVARLFERLPAATKQWPSAVAFKEAIAIAKRTGIGKPAMDFTQSDTLGNPVSLSQFRGQYVLVDFWASWCGPCRGENPNVVQAFNQYKDKGFTVLGVSLDRPNGKDRWLKAIHDDGLTWTHVSDLKFWDNAVAKQYGIRMIPQNVLIDPHGKIIDRNLRGNALLQKLSTLFAEKPTF